MHKGVEVVRGEDEAVAGAVVAPAAQHQVATQGVLERARQVLIEDGVQVVVIATWEDRKKEKNHISCALYGNVIRLHYFPFQSIQVLFIHICLLLAVVVVLVIFTAVGSGL